VACDGEALIMRRPWPTMGLLRHSRQKMVSGKKAFYLLCGVRSVGLGVSRHRVKQSYPSVALNFWLRIFLLQVWKRGFNR
jgi:hypothetical protein